MVDIINYCIVNTPCNFRATDRNRKTVKNPDSFFRYLRMMQKIRLIYNALH
jgi:hypothetical protein